MKFVILSQLTKSNLEKMQNKKVCDVTEYVVPTSTGTYKGWIGSVECEYFSITFVKGVLSISLEEREMCLGRTISNVAMVEHLHKTVTKKGIKLESLQDIVYEYNLSGSELDVKSITFKDVMGVLKWKLKRGIKVDEHFLNPY